MKRDIGNWSLVVAGHWNRRIFNPPWLAEQLKVTGEIEIQVAIDEPLLPMQFVFEGICLRAHPRKLEFKFPKEDFSLCGRAAELASKLLTLLPHTPIQGVGWNFHYVEERANKSMLDAFELNDNNALSDVGCSIHQTTIHRVLKLADGQQLNLHVSLDENTIVRVGFNYHSSANDSNTALGFLKNDARAFQTRSEEILQKVYAIDQLED